MGLPLCELVQLSSLSIDTPLLLFESDGRLVRWNLATGERQVVSDRGFLPHPDGVPSPDGRWVSYDGLLRDGDEWQYWLYDKQSRCARLYAGSRTAVRCQPKPNPGSPASRQVRQMASKVSSERTPCGARKHRSRSHARKPPVLPGHAGKTRECRLRIPPTRPFVQRALRR